MKIPKGQLNDKIRDLKDKGLWQYQIAKQTGYSPSTISRHSLEMDLPRTQKPKKIKVRKKNTRLCSCCGIRYVPAEPINNVKLIRLCYHCWRRGEDNLL